MKRFFRKLEAQVGQKSLTSIRLIMICYIVPWWPSWISEQKDFSNSESLCHCDASHQVLVNPTYGLGGDVIEEFHNGVHGGLLGYRNCTTLAILNLYVAPMPPIKFWLNPTYGLGGDVV